MTATSIGVEFIRINRVQCFDSYQRKEVRLLAWTSFFVWHSEKIEIKSENVQKLTQKACFGEIIQL